MKNLNKMLLATCALIGIGGAYATKPQQFNGTTYYAVTSGLGNCSFCWVKTKPDPAFFFCDVCSGGYCTIVTIGGYMPVCNVTPSATQATPTSTTHRIYKRIP
ncbi:hypothetical protein [Chitinophaga sp. CC14]|uniref:hypothetical protein n=1 Tax=Chitinophaga sp. CC14 TaxID=3029199 RepID=UPI003B984410